MHSIVKVLIFMFLMLMLAGCSPTADIATPPPTSTQPAAAAPSEPEDPGRYFNEAGNFSLNLPEGWEVAGPNEASSGGDLTFSLYRLGVDPQASGGPGMSSIAISDLGAMTIEAFVQAQCSTCPHAPIEELHLGEVRAHQTTIGGGGVPLEIAWTFIEHRGKLIALAIHDPETLEPLSAVLQSVKLH